MVKVKICGITNWTDARLAADVGADALGFNFYKPSPRYISPEDARRIVGRLPRRVQAVGVFVNAPPAAVLRIARDADLEILQLHGEESPAAVRGLADFYPVIKVFRVRRGFRPGRLARYAAAGAFLLDGFAANRRGGTGKTFEWSVARQAKRYGAIILAGGLGPANVEQAIREVRPFAIDVCSGVESQPGEKDPARLRELMHAVEMARSKIR